MAKDILQQKVIDAGPDSRQLVLAGPGTGKTEAVARRIVRLLKQGVKPRNLLVLSFSRSAVSTLIKRIEAVSAENSEALDDLRHISVRTFDSWTFRMLRLMGHRPAELLGHSHTKNIDLLVRILNDSVGKPIENFPSDIQHLIVDEFQDLSGSRGALVLALLARFSPPGGAGAGFSILGDEAQAIYGFGLEDEEDREIAKLTAARLIQEVRTRYKNELLEIELEKNHRSVSEIAGIAAKLREILQSRRTGKNKLSAIQKELDRLPVLEDAGVERLAGMLGNGSIAILTKTNGEAIRVAAKILGKTEESAAIELTLRTTNRVKLVPPWLGATLGPLQDTSVTRSRFAKIYQHLYGEGRGSGYPGMLIPSCDLAWSTLSRWTDGTPDASQVDLLKLRSRLDWVDQIPDDQLAEAGGLQVMTIHQSKGQEFETVLLLDGEEDGDEEKRDHEADANVAYVAVSRPRREVARMDRESIYDIFPKKFDSGRRRWTSWKYGWVNIELGLPGDVEPTGFVDCDLHGSADEVMKVQELLARGGKQLIGRKVVLCKHAISPGHYVYRIHLQENDEPGRLLGVMREQVTMDVVNLIHGHGHSLPGRIFNLRVAAISSMTVSHELPKSIAPKWAVSGLWLGIVLQGTGDFKTTRAR